MLHELQNVALSPRVADMVEWKTQPREVFPVQSCYGWWRRERQRLSVITHKSGKVWRAKIQSKSRLSYAHMLVLFPMARGIWRALCMATGMVGDFSTLEGMWEAGKNQRKKGGKSAMAKISQSYVPAATWLIWITRNRALFKGERMYENMWEMVVRLIMD